MCDGEKKEKEVTGESAESRQKGFIVNPLDWIVNSLDWIINPYRPYFYERMVRDLKALEQRYPELLVLDNIGKSVEGRMLVCYRFGRGARMILLVGAQHAREYITTGFLLYMTERYAWGYRENRRSKGVSFREVLDAVTFITVPMLNPDGINIVQNGFEAAGDPERIRRMPLTEGKEFGYRCWKANGNGVDLNRNFDVLWVEGGEPSSSEYHGPYPASEPETRAMQRFIDETEFSLLASFHTQGEMIYWAEDNTAERLAKIHEPYVDLLISETGFQKMPIEEQHGEGGFLTDYVRRYKEKLAVTIELCPHIGPYPYPESDFDRIARPVERIGLTLAKIALEMGDEV